MTKRVTIACVAAALTFLAASPARAEIGSIISSFPVVGDCGIHREGNYVYVSQNQNNYNYVRTYTITGVYIRRDRLLGADPYALTSGSRTHLGAGYVALCDGRENMLQIFQLSGGSPVASFAARSGLYNCFWTGEYYYVNSRDDRGRFVRYTSSGRRVGSWTCSGWAPFPYCGGAEYAHCANKSEGPYLVASNGGTTGGITTFPGGSLVSTWQFPSVYLKHLAYGDSSNPGVYGAAIWAILKETTEYVIEIDIDARDADSVVPASLGKVKTIYR